MKPNTARRFAALLVGLAAAGMAVVVLVVLWRLHLRYVNAVIVLGLVCFGSVALMLAGWRLLRAFLYKVGRRLAFSYFLLGGLPIPMLLLLVGVIGYLLANFFLGHVYRDALRSVDGEVAEATRDRATPYLAGGRPALAPTAAAAATQATLAAGGHASGDILQGMAFAYYENGRRVGGDNRAPALWPSWAEVPDPARSTAAAASPAPAATSAAGSSGALIGQPGSESGIPLPRFFARTDRGPTLAAAAGTARRGVIGIYSGDLDREVSQRSGVWVETNRPDDPDTTMHIGMGGYDLPPLTPRPARDVGEAEKFFKRRSRGHWFWDKQMLWWGQCSGPLLDAGSGRQIASTLQVNLAGTPRILKDHLFSVNGDIDAQAWGLMVGLGLLLANVYAVAAAMAIFMIIGLSRAVNRMSQATDAVRRGDFDARISVRRRDQLGDLQRTFNEMATNLQTLVAASAQKEMLEKELALARDLQNSLIPSQLPTGEGVEFATLFEPSAAIGGDYFDVLRISPRELAVIIADVSGHGLSTGLRMAMLKAALLILIEQTRDPQEILLRLDAVVRANAEARFFVTATLATFDVRLGTLSLTNAGHPPTYLVRASGEVEEIMLPSSPLGGLGHSYVRRDVQLQRGDLVVWLSDGLFEGVDGHDEPFGYDRVRAALAAPTPAPSLTAARETGRLGSRAGSGTLSSSTARGGAVPGEQSASRVRDRLLAAIAHHVGDLPPSDDRTLVVMRWLGPVGIKEAAAAETLAEVGAPA